MRCDKRNFSKNKKGSPVAFDSACWKNHRWLHLLRNRKPYQFQAYDRALDNQES